MNSDFNYYEWFSLSLVMYLCLFVVVCLILLWLYQISLGSYLHEIFVFYHFIFNFYVLLYFSCDFIGFWFQPWASLVAQLVKNLPAMQKTPARSVGWKDSWRRKCLPIPIFLPREFHGQRSLAGYNPQGCKESDMTKHSTTQFSQFIFVEESDTTE